jgi:hypothetical protein
MERSARESPMLIVTLIELLLATMLCVNRGTYGDTACDQRVLGNAGERIQEHI